MVWPGWPHRQPGQFHLPGTAVPTAWTSRTKSDYSPLASNRAETATASDLQWFPLAQSLTNLTAIPRPTASSSQEELDSHYRAYLAVVIACLPAGVVLPTE
jgi:hypothetical protein